MENFNIFYKYLQKNIFYLIYILFYLIARKEIEIWNKFILSMLSNNLYKYFLETIKHMQLKSTLRSTWLFYICFGITDECRFLLKN